MVIHADTAGSVDNQGHVERAVSKDSTGLIVCAFGRDLAITHADPGCCRFFGTNREEIFGRSILEFLAPQEEQLLRQQVSSISPRSPAASYEQRVEALDATASWFEWIIAGVLGPGGETDRFVAVGRDVTESRKSLQQLKDSELRYRAVVEDQMELVCRYTPDFVLTFVNKAYCLHLDRSREELIGQSILPQIRPADRKRLHHFVRAATPEKPSNRETQSVTNSRGKQLWLDWCRRAFFDNEGRLYEVQAVGTDITELKNAEEALRASEKALRSKNAELEKKNIALKEVLEQIEEQKQRIKDNVIANVDHCLLPALQHLRSRASVDEIEKCADLLERNLTTLTTSFGRRITQHSLGLTRREIEICAMISNGLTSKEIADLLHISINTVGRHRNSIRRKAGITNDKVNLHSHLHSLSEGLPGPQAV